MWAWPFQETHHAISCAVRVRVLSALVAGVRRSESITCIHAVAFTQSLYEWFHIINY